MPLTLLRHATQKPPMGPLKLDIGHPLGIGLLGAWVFNDTGSATACDAVRGNTALLTNATWATGPNGPVMSLDPFGNSAYGVISNATYLLPHYPFTVLLDWYAVEIHGSQRLITVDDTIDSNGIELPWGFNTQSGFEFVFRDTSNNDQGAQTGLAITTGQWYTLVGRVSSAGVSTLFVNSTAYAGGTAASQKTSGSAIQIGRFNQTYSQFSGGYFSRFYIWNRALSNVEVATLHYQVEPFAMFQTRTLQRWFTVAGAPVFNPATVPWAGQAPDMTQVQLVEF